MAKKTIGATAYVMINNQGIQVLVGEYKKNKIIVKNFYSRQLEEGAILNGVIMNSIVITNTLRDLFEKEKIHSKEVHLVIDGSSMTVRPMELPANAQKNYDTMIRSELRDIENIKDMVVDYSILNPKTANGTCAILAVASTKDFLTSYISIFNEAKVELSCIDIAQNCMIKLALNLKSLSDKTCCFMVLDKTMLNQFLFSEGKFIMVRRSRLISEPGTPEFESELGRTINTLIQFNKSEQSDKDLNFFYMCGFTEESLSLFPIYSQNFNITVQKFPEYQPTELALPEGMDPSTMPILIGSMIRYSA